MCMLALRELLLPGEKIVALTGAGGKTTLAKALAGQLSGWGRKVLMLSVSDSAPPSRNLVLLDSLTRVPPYRCLTMGRCLDAATGMLKGIAPETIPEVAERFRADVVLVEVGISAGRSVKVWGQSQPEVPQSADVVMAVAGLDAVGKAASLETVSGLEQYCRITGLEPGAPITLEALKLLLRHPLGFFKGSPENARRLLFLNKAEIWEPRERGSIEATLGECSLWVVGSALQRWFLPHLTPASGT